MQWLKTIFEELVGLFVDDGSFEIAILAWLGLVWLLPHLHLPAAWNGPILFAGLGLILVESVLRRARK